METIPSAFPQFIIDKRGSLIEVIDLELAISQVKIYMGLLMEEAGTISPKSLAAYQSYWADLYSKLKKLETKHENHEKN